MYTNQKLPSKLDIIEPTIALINSINTKEIYLEFSSPGGASINHLDRGKLIQAANPSLTIKQARNRGNKVYSKLQIALDEKAKEGIDKGWINELGSRKQNKRFTGTVIKKLIEETAKKYSTQSELVSVDSYLRDYLQNETISKEEVSTINDEYKELMKGQTVVLFSAWEIINLYWAMYTNNRRYIGLDKKTIYSSVPECLVGNYLYLSNISFEPQAILKSLKRVPDFKLLDLDIYIEVLMCDPSDQRACARGSKRKIYSERARQKTQEYQSKNLEVKSINGDCSEKELYEQMNQLMHVLHPEVTPPKFKKICRYHKDNLAYLLDVSDEYIYKKIDDLSGTANFRNTNYAEYRFLKNNRSNFDKIWQEALERSKKQRITRSVQTRLNNTNYLTTIGHIEAIHNSNLKKAIGHLPWLKNRQRLYNDWATHYNDHLETFTKLGISKPPANFKYTFYVGAGGDGKNVKIAKFFK